MIKNSGTAGRDCKKINNTTQLLAEFKNLYSVKTHSFVTLKIKGLMEKRVGRIQEKKILEDAFASARAELIAIHGHRRIGKIFLIRSVYE